MLVAWILVTRTLFSVTLTFFGELHQRTTPLFLLVLFGCLFSLLLWSMAPVSVLLDFVPMMLVFMLVGLLIFFGNLFGRYFVLLFMFMDVNVLILLVDLSLWWWMLSALTPLWLPLLAENSLMILRLFASLIIVSLFRLSYFLSTLSMLLCGCFNSIHVVDFVVICSMGILFRGTMPRMTLRFGLK